MDARIAVAALVALWSCRGEPAESAPAAAAHPADAATEGDELEVRLSPAALATAALRTGTARESGRRTVVTAAGTLEFATRNVARVGPLIEGRVLTVGVEPGQRVEAGAVLATVQSFEIGRARSELVTAGMHSRMADVELQRQMSMADAGVTSGREVYAAESQRALARLEMAAAAERLRAMGAARGGAGPSGGTSALPLVAPIAGVVLEVAARIGQTVGATDTLFVVGRTDAVWLVVDVYERDYARVHTDDAARVTLPAYPGRVFEGRVEYVGGMLDPATRAAPVRIVLTNTDGALRPGMSATARIASAEATDVRVVTVPRGAIQTIDGQPFVFVERASGRYEARPVERGPEVEGDVEIARGLRGGEPVVVDGAFVLKTEVLRAQMGTND